MLVHGLGLEGGTTPFLSGNDTLTLFTPSVMSYHPQSSQMSKNLFQSREFELKLENRTGSNCN